MSPWMRRLHQIVQDAREAEFRKWKEENLHLRMPRTLDSTRVVSAEVVADLLTQLPAANILQPCSSADAVCVRLGDGYEVTPTSTNESEPR